MQLIYLLIMGLKRKIYMKIVKKSFVIAVLTSSLISFIFASSIPSTQIPLSGAQDHQLEGVLKGSPGSGKGRGSVSFVDLEETGQVLLPGTAAQPEPTRIRHSRTVSFAGETDLSDLFPKTFAIDELVANLKNKFHTEIARLKKDKDESDKVIQNLMNQIKVLNQGISKLNSIECERTGRAKDLDNEIKRLREELKQVKSYKKGLSDDLQAEKTAKENVRRANEELSAKVADLNKKLSEQSEIIKKLQDQHAAANGYPAGK